MGQQRDLLRTQELSDEPNVLLRNPIGRIGNLQHMASAKDLGLQPGPLPSQPLDLPDKQLHGMKSEPRRIVLMISVGRSGQHKVIHPTDACLRVPETGGYAGPQQGLDHSRLPPVSARRAVGWRRWAAWA